MQQSKISLRTKIEQYLKKLEATEHYDEELQMNTWPDNPFVYHLSVTISASSAMLIAREFKGHVFGYYLDQQPNENLIGFWAGGHNFCIVDDLLIDYWAHYVENPCYRPVIDLTDPNDLAYFTNHYLPRKKWKTLKPWKLKKTNNT